MASVLDLYRKISSLPWGSRLFGMAVGFKAPYFASIRPSVTALRPGFCQVTIPDRRGVHNHIGSIHAAALCNVAELAGGLSVDATIPRALRWIPRGMTVEYLAKAHGTLVAECTVDPAAIQPGDLTLPVVVSDRGGKHVLRAEITFYISRKAQC